jgi:hypothetical protein
VSHGGMSLSHILVCLVPTPGHMNPLLAVAQHLSGVGHNVTILTADVFTDKVIAAGLDFIYPLRGSPTTTTVASRISFWISGIFAAWTSQSTISSTHLEIRYPIKTNVSARSWPNDDRSDSRGCTVFGGFSPVAGSQEQPAPNRWLRSRSSANDKCRFWTVLAARYDTGRITAKQGREPPVRGCFPTSH